MENFNSREQALNRLSLEAFKNQYCAELPTGSLLEFLSPLILIPICGSFFQSFVNFDNLVSFYLHVFLSFLCCLVFSSSLPCSFVSAGFHL